MIYPARIAREQAGLSLAEAARQINRCSAYLRRIELHGRAPLHVSERLAALYARNGAPCSIEIFLTPPYLGVIGVPSATGQDIGDSCPARRYRKSRSGY